MNKTERFINILHAVSSSPGRKIRHNKLLELLGNPSRSQTHKLISELTIGTGYMEPILDVSNNKRPEERIYKLNSRIWDDFITAGSEGFFFLEAFKRLGKVINCDYTQMSFSDAFEFEGRKVVELDRKFIYLSKIEVKITPQFKVLLNDLVKALLENRQIVIDYSPININGNIERLIEPLTLCQYRDDLYIMCYKIEGDKKVQRNYKVSRINNVTLTNNVFTYPSRSTWNPDEDYKHSSGIILGQSSLATINVYGSTRNLFEEKVFFNNTKVKSEKDYDQYQCSFTNENEFLGQLFIYAQDIEVLAPSILREHFIEKAKRALERYQNSKKQEAS